MVGSSSEYGHIMTPTADASGDAADPIGDTASTTTADRLADAAISLIARSGFDSLSVRRVATEASVTGGTVQHHFPSKVELTVAALDRTVQRQTGRVRALPPRNASAVERFVGELCAILPADRASTEEAVVWIAMSAAVPAHPFVAERQRRAAATTRRWIESAVRRAQADGEVGADIDVVEVTPLIEAALDGMMQRIIADDELQGEIGCRQLRTMVRRLLRLDGD
jgi:AcrR family transcriptional regulator